MSDLDTLRHLVQCQQTDVMPAAITLHTMTAAALETAPAASRPLILLVHVLGAVAFSIDSAARRSPVGISSAPYCTSDFLKMEIKMKQMALLCLQHNLGKEQTGMTDYQGVMPALMRSAILLFKLADLTPTLSTREDLSDALRMAVSGVVKRSKSASTAEQEPGSSPEQHQLGLVLVQLIVRMLRQDQDIWQATRSIRAKTCVQLLTCLVAWSPTRSTAVSATCTKGNANAMTEDRELPFRLVVQRGRGRGQGKRGALQTTPYGSMAGPTRSLSPEDCVKSIPTCSVGICSCFNHVVNVL